MTLFKVAEVSQFEDFKKDQKYNPDLPSMAVIANNSNSGIILWYIGFDLDIEIKEAGLQSLEYLGLDDASEGISIWEGKYFWSPGPFEYPEDGESYPQGCFREPTEEEWRSIKLGICPWDKYGQVIENGK